LIHYDFLLRKASIQSVDPLHPEARAAAQITVLSEGIFLHHERGP
jgi:hypothetical protein